MSETKTTNLTLKQRQRIQGKVVPQKSEQKNGKELSRVVAILLLLLAFGGGTALGMIYFRPDPRLQELEDMQAVLADQFTPGDMRREFGGEMQELAESLPANLRGRGGMGRGEDRIAKFFAKSSADQLAELKARAEREKEWEARRAEMEAEAAANGTAKPADSSQANNNGNNGNGRGRGGKNDDQRVQRMEQRLANRPPQQRAQGGLFRQMVNAVRQQAAHQ